MADRNTSGISTRSCLVAAAVVVVLLVVMIAGLVISGPKAIERQRIARVNAQFNAAKGRSSAHVIFDPEPIKLLAEDEESVENLTKLYLSSINFRDIDMTTASKLSNLTRIQIYSCNNIENFLSAAQELPALEELSFEETPLSDESVRLLATFPNLKELHFFSCNGTENLLSKMQGSAMLEELSFEATTLSDEGVKLLATFPNLKKVRFNYVAEQERVDLLKSTIPHVTLEIDETK